ncbi:MAG: BON domain-containing protein [Candidatus Rokubacteria bacterium]|nr:BON domain-containing protein [Candidatus Rokubacteria bacterium]
MSIVAISDTLGSLGDVMGRELARRLGWQFADREVIAKAAEQFGEAVGELHQVTEERPSLWERFTDSKRRYLLYIEASVFELAARDHVVIVGHGAAIMLRDIPHALRVRVSAPERARVERVRRTQAASEAAAVDAVRDSDTERASRMRYLYRVDVDDAFLYDLTINSERVDVDDGVRVMAEALRLQRVQTTEESQAAAVDRACTALARARLAADPRTRSQRLSVETERSRLTLRGFADSDGHKRAALEIVRAVPGVIDTVDETVIPSVVDAFPRT